MADKNRSQQDQQRQSDLSDQNRSGEQQQQGSRSNVSNQEEQFDNPQEGEKWENYRTRELSGNEERSSDKDISQKDRNK